MKYIIGLDMGITSVGFASMMLDDNDEPCRIIHMGSRIFEAAENPKDGSSLAAPRRENRSMRRRLRRKRHRKERIKNLIIQNNMIIGAVTHVVVDDPIKGYGIFITNMLEEAEN